MLSRTIKWRRLKPSCSIIECSVLTIARQLDDRYLIQVTIKVSFHSRDNSNDTHISTEAMKILVQAVRKGRKAGLPYGKFYQLDTIHDRPEPFVIHSNEIVYREYKLSGMYPQKPLIEDNTEICFAIGDVQVRFVDIGSIKSNKAKIEVQWEDNNA